jgi:hypothetical protein
LALHIGCGQWGREKSRIEFFPGNCDKSGKSFDLVARGFCNKHFKLAKNIGEEALSENNKLSYYETAVETGRTISTSLKSGEDAEIFDDDSSFDEAMSTDGSSFEANEEIVRNIPPLAGNLKRKTSDSSRLSQNLQPLNQKKRKQNTSFVGPKVSGKTSVYLEKKKRIQQYSLLMVQDLEKRLKSGTSVRKAVKIVSNHWKNKLTESEFKMCREKNDDDMNALILLYRRQEESKTEVATKKERKSGRWKHLFMPSFKFGSTLTTEWDKEEEIFPGN